MARLAQPPAPLETKAPSIHGLAPSPHVFSRTALFGAASKNARKLLAADEDLVVIDDETGYKVSLTGGLRSRIPGPYGSEGEVVSSRFDQFDFTVLLGLIEYVGGTLGREVIFEPYRFLRTIGRPGTPQSARSVFNSIARMHETRVSVSYLDRNSGAAVDYVGRLINAVGYHHGTRQYSISLNPHLAQLFAPAHYSSIDWQHRLAIKGSLAQWLHAELTSHDSGFVRWTHELEKAYGYGSGPRRFRLELRKAAQEVERVTGWSLEFKTHGTGTEQLVARKAQKPEAGKPKAQA